MKPIIRQDPTTLLSHLAPELRMVLSCAASVARQMDTRLWLVGGVVRDLLIGEAIAYDIDIVMKGEAGVFAHHMLKAMGVGSVVATHHHFGTATVELPAFSLGTHSGESITLDIATARTERYAHPAALPTVQPAAIEQDLGRRDFTVNAMALEIGGIDIDEPARFLDPLGGMQDLEAGVLRVLHEQSFLDDPTRIVRGLRQAVRLGMHFSPETEALLRQSCQKNMIEVTSPDRIRTELCLVLEEPRPDEVLRTADALDITRHIFPSLRWSEEMTQWCSRVLADDQLSPSLKPAVLTGLLTYHLNEEERETFAMRYRLPGDTVKLLRNVGKLKRLVNRLLLPDLRNSLLDKVLHPFCTAALRVMCYTEPVLVCRTIRRYLQEVRPITPALDGHQLQLLGVARGPEIGYLLRELRDARLDGVLTTRAEEEAWVRQHIGLPPQEE